MQILLTEDQTLIRESAVRFCADHGGADRLRKLRAGKSGFDRDALVTAGQDGWLGLVTPQSADGAGLGMTELCLFAEEMGRVLCATPVISSAIGVLALSHSAGPDTDDLRIRALSGDALVLPAFASNKNDIAAEHTPDGGLVLSGRVSAVPAATAADVFVVYVESNVARVLLFVHSDADGVTIIDRRAVDGSVLAGIEFDNVVVSVNQILAQGDEAQASYKRCDAMLHLGLAAELLGIIDGALATTLEFLTTRKQFGRALSSFQALQHKAVEISLQVESNRGLIYETALALVRKDNHAGILASAARARVGKAALAIGNACIQLHGAMGFTDEHHIGMYLKRALTVSSSYGTNAIHKARYLRESRRDDPDGILPQFRIDDEDDAKFRQEVRNWLEETLPPSLRNLPGRPSFEEASWWHGKLAEIGWIAPAWPVEWGGMQASLNQQITLADELSRIGAPEISGQAIGHIGPIMIRFGTEEQKRRHLPGMISGTVVWCQGYSEPGAGSDLASLRTSAVRDGDHFIINGQKIWTTWGHLANWMFALVRTDSQVEKTQEGITFILIDMQTPGITRRGIQTIANDDEFAEVFFDDVRVPVENVVGKIGEGWNIATALLANERTNGANPRGAVAALRRLKELAREMGAIEDPAFRDQLASIELDILAITASFAQVVAHSQAGKLLGPHSSFIKLMGTETLQKIADLMIEASGSDGALQAQPSIGHAQFDAATFFLRARRATIAAGTSEIQKNIIARRVLNLR